MSLHPTRRPFEARVVAEKSELDIRLFALEQFLYTDQFKAIDPAEQDRLQRQYRAMQEYLGVLVERITAFKPVEEAAPVNLNDPGPRGHEKLIPVTELNPELAGQAIFKEEVPIGAKPIEDIDTFAMMVDQWHGKCMEQGNRLLEIPEGTEVTVEDHSKPGEVVQMNLDGAYLHVFRVGVEAALNVFKDLPFGASLEDAPE